MPDQPPAVLVIPKTPLLPYVWAALCFAALGAGLVVVILYLRPNSDPMDVIERVASPLIPTLAAAMAWLKSQETHLSINSRLTEFMRTATDAADAKGQLKGVADEQMRQAKQSSLVPPPTSVD